MSCMLQQHGIIGNNIQAAGIKLIFDLGNCSIDAAFHPREFLRSVDDRPYLRRHRRAIVNAKSAPKITSDIVSPTAMERPYHCRIERVRKRDGVIVKIGDEAPFESVGPFRIIPAQFAKSSGF